MSEKIRVSAVIPDELASARLDQAAAQLFPDYSRSRLQGWIKSGELKVNGTSSRPKDKVFGGEELVISAELKDEGSWEPQAIDFGLVHEDEALLVLNKPAGLVVHPAAGHSDGTLVNALLSHCPELVQLPRAGIVHRLDKDTSGLMVVAKTLESHHALVKQLQARTVHREYEALVFGAMTGGGRVDQPMGRHPQQRKKMAVVKGGKEAVTHYRLLKRFAHFSHVRCLLETGRTHQIRVHMAHIKHPLIGDPQYAGRPRIPKGASETLLDAVRGFRRQALHARRLELLHPLSQEPCAWESELPEDFLTLARILAEEDPA
ncbi:MAG TPA: 23S rRNA pseudouridine(1911/1915/1917) synthase RluD [Spongiibacteraceae bacterium]|nr:23S rRNA pseudouridine(1911/1915/1917) synthase RluD [Spongiibacteraceae bacterium]HCS29656.1 23S rRNA pseudouridine(1911/1915/1917) synthase RluD [Spongiibacteraceae bacterium]|tara:strand:- start:233 stop:1186 length:954 start_codon:yes stop_codon:yes gene_type:complete